MVSVLAQKWVSDGQQSVIQIPREGDIERSTSRSPEPRLDEMLAEWIEDFYQLAFASMARAQG
jgi:hypothetical protein